MRVSRADASLATRRRHPLACRRRRATRGEGARTAHGQCARTARGQCGFVLIEVLVAMAIFGVVAVAFMGALVTGYRGVLVSREQTMAASLTRSALEDVRHTAFPYQTGSDNVTTSSRFIVTVHADNVTLGLNGDDESTYTVVEAPSTYQMITVTVSDNETGRVILQTQEAKSQP